MENKTLDKENLEEGEEGEIGGLSNLKEEIVKMDKTSAEELNELKADLVKVFETKETLDEDKVLKLLKILARKEINIELLKESGVGKILTRIEKKPDGFFSDDNAVKDKAKNLRN